MLKQWRRAWCVIRDGTLTVHRIGSKGSEILAEMALVLCNVKPVRSKAPDEKAARYYLELRSPQEFVLLQALTEATMAAWADALRAAVAAAYGAGTTTVGAAAGVPMIKQASALLATGARCADCGAAAPEWASANLCVLLCLECAGCHRAMGTHLSKVRSLKLDSWEPPLLALLSRLQPASDGTGGANAVWEAALNGASPPTVRRPTPSDGAGGAGHREHREVFVRLKYELREFVDKSGDAAALGAALLAACEGEQPEEALRLIASGASVDYEAVVEGDGGGGGGRCVLDAARAAGSELCAELLVQNGAGLAARAAAEAAAAEAEAEVRAAAAAEAEAAAAAALAEAAAEKEAEAAAAAARRQEAVAHVTDAAEEVASAATAAAARATDAVAATAGAAAASANAAAASAGAALGRGANIGKSLFGEAKNLVGGLASNIVGDDGGGGAVGALAAALPARATAAWRAPAAATDAADAADAAPEALEMEAPPPPPPRKQPSAPSSPSLPPARRPRRRRRPSRRRRRPSRRSSTSSLGRRRRRLRRRPWRRSRRSSPSSSGRRRRPRRRRRRRRSERENFCGVIWLYVARSLQETQLALRSRGEPQAPTRARRRRFWRTRRAVPAPPRWSSSSPPAASQRRAPRRRSFGTA